jgi:uncharacterized BrkB/YihY/UPF0761 family membrane protein
MSRDKFATASETARSASERHVSLAVTFRAVERNRRVAASVLAGGLAYRLFLWSLPFGLLLGGALGFMNARSTEEAVATGGIPAAISKAVGDASRSAHSDSWWLLAVGVPLLLWAGYSGAKTVKLIHAVVWEEPPPKASPLAESLAFTGVLCAVWADVVLTWWLRDDESIGILVAVLDIAPLAGLWLWVSLRLPHGNASWQALLPGALLVALGFQVLHHVVVIFLVPKLDKSASLYGSLGATTTLIFFIYLMATLVVTAPILNSSLYRELHSRRETAPDDETTSPAGAPLG